MLRGHTGSCADGHDGSGRSSADTLISGASLQRWVGWRMRLLMGLVLVACLALFWLAHALAARPSMGPALWEGRHDGRIVLQWARDPALRSAHGQELQALGAPGAPQLRPDALLLERSARWLADDTRRERYLHLHDRIGSALAAPVIRLYFPGRPAYELSLQPRSLADLGLLFWLLCGLALGLHAIAAAVLLSRPGWLSLLYTVMVLSQAAQLLLIGIASTHDLAWSPGMARHDLQARLLLDLLTAAAALHSCVLVSRSGAAGRSWVITGWGAALLAGALLLREPPVPHLWWWVQGTCSALALGSVLVLRRALRREPHPYARLLQRIGLATLGGWLLLSAAVAWAGDRFPVQQAVTALGPTIWHVLLASLLALFPFLSGSRHLMSRFSLLAAVTTAATTLDLIFVTVFALGHVTSLTLTLFVSLGLYLVARQWLMDRLVGSSMRTTERMFEHLYRIAREVEQQPQRTAELLERLLRELFEPLEVLRVARSLPYSRVAGDGSTLVVPIPMLSRPPKPVAAEGSIVLRFAHNGRHLFTAEDARLTDQVFEQLRRAVAYDRAVEEGRTEERMRIAQDLHDDIGARLLTLMYKAPSPDMEEYIRHTLQDLKTLTRGLAAQEHRLSEAAAEWKADLEQRLALAGCELVWRVEAEQDPLLGVVQWSALTRVLRELTSNALMHARATRLEVSLCLEGGRLELVVRDDGEGGDPAAWSAGLGLGGVRKRVRQLGGQVCWRPASPRGIECRVQVESFC